MMTTVTPGSSHERWRCKDSPLNPSREALIRSGLAKLGPERVAQGLVAFDHYLRPDYPSGWSGCYLARAYGACRALVETWPQRPGTTPKTAGCYPAGFWPIRAVAELLGLTTEEAAAIAVAFDTKPVALRRLIDEYLSAYAARAHAAPAPTFALVAPAPTPLLAMAGGR